VARKSRNERVAPLFSDTLNDINRDTGVSKVGITHMLAVQMREKKKKRGIDNLI